jgi:hypothetical protein
MSEVRPWDKKTCDILYKQNVINPEQYEKVLEEKKKFPQISLTQLCINLGFVQEPQIQSTLEKFYQIQGINLSQFHRR